MANCYADTSEILDPSLGVIPIKQTKNQIENKYKDLERQFPDIKDSITSIYPSVDNHVIVSFLSSFYLPDSTKFSLPICTIFTIQKGKIIKD